MRHIARIEFGRGKIGVFGPQQVVSLGDEVHDHLDVIESTTAPGDGRAVVRRSVEMDDLGKIGVTRIVIGESNRDARRTGRTTQL